MLGKWMFFIYDEVLNARYLKKGTRWNIKIKIPKVKFYVKYADAISLHSNRFQKDVMQLQYLKTRSIYR